MASASLHIHPLQWRRGVATKCPSLKITSVSQNERIINAMHRYPHLEKRYFSSWAVQNQVFHGIFILYLLQKKACLYVTFMDFGHVCVVLVCRGEVSSKEGSDGWHPSCQMSYSQPTSVQFCFRKLSCGHIGVLGFAPLMYAYQKWKMGPRREEKKCQQFLYGWSTLILKKSLLSHKNIEAL